MIVPYHEHEGSVLYHGDSLDVLKTLDDNSMDSVVTDPPYGLTNARPQIFKSVRDPSVNKGAKGFMGMEWDHGVPSAEYWVEVLRVAKPGAHMFAFGGTRTFHRLACAIEDAGWEIRDCIMWVYGSGFPKSLDVSKAMDKSAGHRRASNYKPNQMNVVFGDKMGGGEWNALSEPAVSDAAKQWDGWGTALKPAWEPIMVARKPIEGTVACNVLKYGTGALNIDESRVELDGDYKSKPNGRPSQTGLSDNYDPAKANQPDAIGRWPANLIHDGSDEVIELFPETKSGRLEPWHEDHGKITGTFGAYSGRKIQGDGFGGDSGLASRFFYCAKASQSERGETNTHPTVKPLALMEYLCKLVTPKGGTVLDPFMGSGTTCLAAKEKGFNFVGIDKTIEYCEIAKQRIVTSEGIFAL